MIGGDTVIRLLVEITTGQPPAVPDDAETAALRAELTQECREIIESGGSVEIPHEVPDLD